MRRTVFLLAALLGFGDMMEGVAQSVKKYHSRCFR